MVRSNPPSSSSASYSPRMPGNTIPLPPIGLSGPFAATGGLLLCNAPPFNGLTSPGHFAGVLPGWSVHFQNGAGLLSGIWLVGNLTVFGCGRLRLCWRGAGVMMELGWYSWSQAPEVSVGEDPVAWAVRPGGRRAARGDGLSEKVGKTCGMA